jgi:uncharacterized protein YdhG (YjbR/CyaY superfamily)
LKKVTSVDEYIALAPAEARSTLTELRKIIKTASPEAIEYISYNMPFYKFQGARVGFAAFKDHVSLFGSVSDEEREQLKGFETTKGTIHFPLGKPLPRKAIIDLIEARMKGNKRQE